jgi:SAM-dependent methyltransferase
MNYKKILSDVIEEHKVSPIDILKNGDALGEYTYLKSSEDSYIRTVRDIDNLCKTERADRNILEIGSFLGPVSISLKRIGYNVSALDIPEFYNSASLRSLYQKSGIPFIGVNLRDYKLPYESDSFDVVIICEVIEHLNFNPLPVLKEINRVLKNGGYIYISTPNQSCFSNRKKLFIGKSIHHPIDFFFQQLDRNNNMVVGLHWREYTLFETIKMIEKMGFETIRSYYFTGKDYARTGFIKMIFDEIIFSYPPLRPSQVVIGKKVDAPIYNFWLTNANS